MKYVLKSVSVFAFTNKLKVVMKGNKLELWIASLTTCAIFTTLIKQTPSIKQTLGKVQKVSA